MADTEDFALREADATDAPALARLCTQLGYPAAADVMPGRLRRLSTDANACAIVVARDNAVIGLVTMHLRHTMNHEAPIAQLSLLVVDERVRAQGAGRALVHAAEEWAASRGAQRVAVTTALNRNGAHAFYERLGYSHTGRRYAKDLASTGNNNG